MDALKEQALGLLRQSLDDPAARFREGQWEAVERLVRTRSRLLVVERTGWGKSLVYFLATRLLRDAGSGPTLLISPLLALMRNQILAAERIRVRAETINSSNREDWQRVEAELLANKIDLLLVSPERLANDEFREKVLLPVAARVGLLVVDEAHCISDWGHDFRPDYKRIVRILHALPRNIPVLATTATANDRVVNDIAAQLGEGLAIIRGALGRESLRLQNIVLPTQAARLAWIAEQLPHLPGSGIIYTLTIRDAKRVAGWLQSRGLDAHAYWGDLETEARENLERRLLANEIKALVATTALGMGFDKPDLGFVIHYQRPASVVHYYQQIGRAGRALPNAYAVLLGGAEDDAIAEYFQSTAFPPEAHVSEVLQALEGAEEGLSVSMLQQQLNRSFGDIDKVLRTLAVAQPAPVVKVGTHWRRTPVPYVPDTEKVAALLAIRRREQSRMQEYLHTRECLMAFLRRELDDPGIVPCGRCASCVGHPLLPETVAEETLREAIRFLRRAEQEFEPRRLWSLDALADDGFKGKIAPELRAEPGRALCLWGDAGWGDLVRQGKQGGRFDDELVKATAAMIRERWQPEPFPEWVTCVPSLVHENLVPDLARRLAAELKLPFVPCIRKVKPTAPQKEMQNSYQQARNLAGAFAVANELVRPAPVLLVDDMVDSRWTFTVLAALLKRSGSGPVYPVALAMTTAGKDPND